MVIIENPILNLATNNFYISAFADEDAPDCEVFLADPEVMKFVGDGHFDFSKTTALNMVRWFRQTCGHSNGLGTWAVVDKKINKVIGNCHLFEFTDSEIEFGLVLGRKYWGKGCGTETCRALLKYGFNQLGHKKIVATVHQDNQASKKLLKKLGYQFARKIEHQGLLQELYLKRE